MCSKNKLDLNRMTADNGINRRNANTGVSPDEKAVKSSKTDKDKAKSSYKNLPSDLIHVRKRLEMAISKIHFTFQKPYSVSGLDALHKSYANIRNVSDFIDIYGREKNPVQPNDRIFRIIGIRPFEIKGNEIAELVLGNKEFQNEILAFESWFISQADNFITDKIPELLSETIISTIKFYSDPIMLRDFHIQVSIYLQLKHADYDLLRFFPDFEKINAVEITDGIDYSSEVDMAFPKKIDGDPDMSDMNIEITSTKMFLKNKAIKAANKYYKSSFGIGDDLFSIENTLYYLLISYHPIIAVIENEPEWKSLGIELNNGGKDANFVVKQITNLAIDKLYESYFEFLSISAENRTISWKRFSPFIDSFIKHLSGNKGLIYEMCKRIKDQKVKESKNVSESLKDLGLAFGVVALLSGLIVLTGGTGSVVALPVGKALAALSLVTDMTAFAFQFNEERQDEIYNRVNLIQQTKNHLPPGTLKKDIFVYFLSMFLYSKILGGIGNSIIKIQRKAVVDELAPKLREVFDELLQTKIHSPKVLNDPDMSRAVQKLSGIKEMKGTSPASKLIGAEQRANRRINRAVKKLVKKGADTAYLDKLKMAASSEIKVLHQLFDPQLRALAHQLDINLVEILDVARKLGIKDPNIALLRILNFEIERIIKFIKVREELLKIRVKIDKINKQIEIHKAMTDDLKLGTDMSRWPKKMAKEKMDLIAKKAQLRDLEKMAVKWQIAAFDINKNIVSQGAWTEADAVLRYGYITALERNFPAFDHFEYISHYPVSQKSIRISEEMYQLLKRDPKVGILLGENQIDLAHNKFVEKWDKAIESLHEFFPENFYLPDNYNDITKVIHLTYICEPPPHNIQQKIYEGLYKILDDFPYNEGNYELLIEFRSRSMQMGIFDNLEEVAKLQQLRWPKTRKVPPIGIMPQKELKNEENPKF